MKPDFYQKLGLGKFAVWEIYYTYWWFTIHKIKRFKDLSLLLFTKK